MSRFDRRPVVVAAVAVAAMIVSACASMGGRAPRSASYAPPTLSPPQSRNQARRQLAYYLRQLQQGRAGLGLAEPSGAGTAGAVAARRPARHDYGGVTKPKSPRRGPEHITKAPAAKRSRPALSPTAAPPPPSVARREAADASADSGAHYRRQRTKCPMPCRHARAICHAARRICSIAAYLGEDDARKRCQSAKQDCKRARDSTKDRCESVCPAKPA